MRYTLEELKKLKSFKKLKRFLCKEGAYTKFHKDLLIEEKEMGSLFVDVKNPSSILLSFKIWGVEGSEHYDKLFRKLIK